ncbi:MAG: DUF5069 domain-containing protein [Proteobacteria bacterium]|jgi:hypothetical protein|nr:DUF5069 domain-containing protein [Chloroflexota bacterium]NBY49443.1 DUF5069 domain-containing protein [Pseudomonadota bacterium]NDF55729.1 DUF5069 domain-containing protein [Pseudomonadota bacterium]HAN14338.1 hypothetical protein [Chloroflexota bacterium]
MKQGEWHMDLINGVPRSGHDTVGGIVLLGRVIDKMRAHIAGTLGEYVSHRGFSADVFELFGTDAETFEEIVRTHDTDEGVLASLMAIKHLTAEEIAAFNLENVTWPANDPAALERMHGRMASAGHGDRLDIVCALDEMDLDEGREVPIGGRHAAGLTHH